jgi:hypothetical protein
VQADGVQPGSPAATEQGRIGVDGWPAAMAPQNAIEGYAGQSGARPGDVLDLCVSTAPAARYRIEVLRLGWYDGAGERVIATLPRRGDLQGLARAAPAPDPATGLCAARWPVTDRVEIGRDWSSGVYVARLLLTSGRHAGRMASVPFVVRPPLDRRADILVQMGVNTAQAYNHWGGKSLYPSNSTQQQPAVKVSFERPFNAWPWANINSRWPFTWDYQLVRFLERHGYDVAYTTDVDTHREPWSLIGHRLIMTSGHDEYWTKEMVDGLEDALAMGSNLACMGANTIYWQARYEDAERTLVEYRDPDLDHHSDRERLTVRFRDLPRPRPECELLGVQYQGGMTSAGLPPRHYTVVAEALDDRWMAGTGFEPGAELKGLVGYEWDGLQSGSDPDDLRVFFEYRNELGDAHAVRHRHRSGATVFSAGSLQFAWGLDDWGQEGHADERLQRFMRNALDDLVRPDHATSRR